MMISGFLLVWIFISMNLVWFILVVVQFLLWRRVDKKNRLTIHNLQEALQKDIQYQRDLVEERACAVEIHEALVEDFNRMVEVSEVFAGVLHHCDRCRKKVDSKFRQAEDKVKLEKIGVVAYKRMKDTF